MFRFYDNVSRSEIVDFGKLSGRRIKKINSERQSNTKEAHLNKQMSLS